MTRSLLAGAQVKERKGLDIVRRDWCALAKRVGDKILVSQLTNVSQRTFASVGVGRRVSESADVR